MPRALSRASAAAGALAVALALPAAAPAAVEITADRVTVTGEGAGATITRKPFRLSVEDAKGQTVWREVENERPAPLVEPPTVDPEQNGADTLPETSLYAPLTFTVGSERIDQFPSGTWVANLNTATRSGTQYSARDVLEATEQDGGVRLVLSTSDPTGRRLVVSVRPDGKGAIRVSARPTPDVGVAVVADSFAAPSDEAFHGFGANERQ